MAYVSRRLAVASIACLEASANYGRNAGSVSNAAELAAEFIGTFTLVSAVCGAALFSAPSAGLVAVAFAVGLSVLAMAFAVGHISGGHFNPAVTCGMVAAGRFESGQGVRLYRRAGARRRRCRGCVFYVILKGAPAGKWNDFVAISNLYGGDGHFRWLGVPDRSR